MNRYCLSSALTPMSRLGQIRSLKNIIFIIKCSILVPCTRGSAAYIAGGDVNKNFELTWTLKRALAQWRDDANRYSHSICFIPR